MNRLLRIYFIVAGFLPAIQTHGQPPDFNWKLLDTTMNSENLKVICDVYILDPVANSNYFLHNDWLKGKLTMEGGDVHENIYMRYDSFHDNLVIYNDQTRIQGIPDKQTISSFEVNDPNLGLSLFRKVEAPGEPEKSKYYRVLYDGKNSLLALHKIIEAKTSLYKDIFGRLRDTEFHKTVIYYLFNEKSGFIRILPGRKAFMALSYTQRKNIRVVLKKNNIRHFNENEMVRAISLLEKEGILK